MMELIRQWLVGVTCAAMIVAVADSLTPKGTVKKIGRLVGGLVLLLSVVKPLMGLDYSVLAMSTVTYQQAADTLGEDLSKTNLDLMKTIIGEKTGAYILDKATALGADCQSVTVTCELGEGEMPYPSAVTVSGALTQGQRSALSKVIEADLGIPAARQSFESGEVKE